MFNCPDIPAEMGKQFHDIVMASLLLPVKRRIKALKKLQFETINIESKFFEEAHALQCKYHRLHIPLYEQRGRIIGGKYEPDDEECNWESDDEDTKNKVQIKEVDKNVEKMEVEFNQKEIYGIPDFWLTIFKNVRVLSEMVQKYDEPILKHLMDIKVLFLENNPMGFVLEFYFSDNEYFSNSVLVKEYEMKCTPDPDDPFDFEGPEIFKCRGCTIDWKKGKNVTLKTIKKKEKSRGVVRTITKTVPNNSCFNFFSPPEVPENADEISDELHALLTNDFEIGHYIRERIMPRAVLYYTGESLEDEECEEDEVENNEEDDEAEDSDLPDAQ